MLQLQVKGFPIIERAVAEGSARVVEDIKEKLSVLISKGALKEETRAAIESALLVNQLAGTITRYVLNELDKVLVLSS